MSHPKPNLCFDEEEWNRRYHDLLDDFDEEVIQQEEGKMTMEKRFVILSDSATWYTEADALNKAKRQCSTQQRPYYVLQAVALVEAPMPEAVVTKL